MREREDVAANRNVVVFVEDAVGAPADHLGIPRFAELLDQRREELREPPLVRGPVRLDLLDVVVHELANAVLE